jgi:hypothetical protein
MQSDHPMMILLTRLRDWGFHIRLRNVTIVG